MATIEIRKSHLKFGGVTSTDLRELERLAKKEYAVITVTFGYGGAQATWKVPGKRAEKIVCRGGDRIVAGSRFPADSVAEILHTLLERLGWQGVPTCDHFVDRMTVRQRARVYELVSEIKAIRATVLGPIAERVHASPRSSLHPQHCQGEEIDE